MCPAKPTQDPAALQDVENFLAGVPAEQRSALERLRAQVRAAAPEAIEMISYGVPAFKYKGRPLYPTRQPKYTVPFSCRARR